MNVLTSGPFTIILDGAGTRRTWTAGDVIRGKARLYSTSDEAVETVNVRFGGRAKSKEYRRSGQNNQKHTYRGRAQFFEINALLYRSHFTLAANKSYEWPFEFTFPSLAPGVAPQDVDKWSAGGPFRTNEQPLPPTMSDKWRQMIGSRGHDAFVEYTLFATLTRPGGGSILDRGYEHQVSLLYLQAGPAAALSVASRTKHISRPYTVKSLLLHPDNQNRQLTFREKTRSVFQKDKLPYFVFDLFLSKMQQIHLGEAHPMTLSLRHKPDASSPLPELPEIVLRSVNASVIADTNVRSERGVFSDHSSSNDIKTPCVIHYNSSPGHGPGAFTKATEYTKSFSVAPLNSPHFVSDFATFNITRSHRLSVKVIVACADQTVELSCTEPLVILPMVGMAARADAPVVDSFDLANSSAAAPPVAGPSSAAPPDNQTLPLYENVTAAPAYSAVASASKQPDGAGASTAPTVASVISKAVYQEPIYTTGPTSPHSPSSPQPADQPVPEAPATSKAREAGYAPEGPPGPGYVLAYVPLGAPGAIPANVSANVGQVAPPPPPQAATSVPARVPLPAQSHVAQLQQPSSTTMNTNPSEDSSAGLHQSQRMLQTLSINSPPQHVPLQPSEAAQPATPQYWAPNSAGQMHSEDQKGKDWDRTY